VLRTQKIVNGLHGIESRERKLDKNGIPKGHAPVPEAGQLLREKLASLLRLGADQIGVPVDVVIQNKFFPAIIFDTADHIDRIEVGSLKPDARLLGNIEIDMGGFHDLQGPGLIFFQNPEGPAARLSFVSDHAAYSQRPVQEPKQPLSLFFRLQLLKSFGQVAMQRIAAEIRNGLEIRQGKILPFQPLQAGINLPPRLQHQSSQQFFAGQNFLLQEFRRNIVDVFDKNKIGVDPLKILQKGAVSAGTEDQAAFFIPERPVMTVGGNNAGRGGLHGQIHAKTNAAAFFKPGNAGLQKSFHGFDMPGGNREMKPADSAPVRNEVRRFPQVFLQRRPDFSASVGVKGNERFGKPAEIQPGWEKNALQNAPDVSPSNHPARGVALFQEGVKRHLTQIAKKRPVQLITAESPALRCGIPQSKHAAGRARRWNKFYHFAAGGLGVIKPNEAPAFRGAQGLNAVTRNTGAYKRQRAESAPVAFQLFFHIGRPKAKRSDTAQILRVKKILAHTGTRAQTLNLLFGGRPFT